MKKIKLLAIALKNFKGIPAKEIVFEGLDTSIYGANEAGKSSLYTAYLWCLTGKDEFDRQDYEIKNTFRKELNGQAHEVEITLDVDGNVATFKRVYLEKWVRPTGESQKKFTGHETEYYCNTVKVSQKDYQEKVDAIIPPSIIKLITNALFFNTTNAKWTWKEQRQVLLGIVPEITNEDIFDSILTVKNKYSGLINAFNAGTTIEDWKKELNSKKKILKENAIGFPHRISEAKGLMPLAENWDAIQQQIAAGNNQIQLIDSNLSDSHKALTEKQKGLMVLTNARFEIEQKILVVRNSIKAKVLNKYNEEISEFSLLDAKIVNAKNAIANIHKQITDRELNETSYRKRLDVKNALVVELRAKWYAIGAEKFIYIEDDCECPTCKQPLLKSETESEINEKKKLLLKNFSANKVKRQVMTNDDSKPIKAEIAQLKESIAADQPNYADQIKALNAGLLSLTSQASTKPVKPSDEETNAAIEALVLHNGDAQNHLDEIKELDESIKIEKGVIAMGHESFEENNDSERETKRAIQLEVKELETKLAKRVIIEQTEKRIAQLELEESVNSQAIADIEKQEFEAETYSRAKMNILEKQVNEKFKYVQFKLFKDLVNGGSEDACICEYKDVAYPTLNTAGKVLASLDVIETLTNHYRIKAPLFIDNRESSSWIPNISSQIINLIVSANDKVLRVVEGESSPTIKAPKKQQVLEMA